ncbi:MAG: cohesin domain-containing protein, partial [Clostridiales bacterium]|nr:cohesin domain-containing protein [Clostridiales bacterium]
MKNKKNLVAILFTAVLVFAFCTTAAAEVLTPPVTNVTAKTLNANIVVSPTVITKISGLDELDAVIADGVTSSVMVAYTGLDDASDLLQAVANKLLAIFIVGTVAEAQELAAWINSTTNNTNGFTDAQIASSDPAVIKAFRTVATRARGSWIIDKEITLDEVSSIIATANSSWALNIMVDANKAEKAVIEQIQRRFTTVWAFSDDTTVGNHRAVTSGVTGIITSDPLKLKEDTSIYTTRTLTRRPFIIAHRGLSSQAPENTCPSYELAIAAGADMMECDVYITKDGEIIFLHDDYFSRTTDISANFNTLFTAEERAAIGRTAAQVRPQDLTLEQIKRLNAAGWAHSTYAPSSRGGWAGLGYDFVEIPTLREVLELMIGGDEESGYSAKDMILVIELKDGNVNHVTPTYEVIREVSEEYGVDMFNQVVFISFQDAEIRHMLNNHPNAPTGRLTAVTSSTDTITHVKNILNTVLPLNSTYNPTYSNINQAKIAQLMARGLSLWPYTINDAANYRNYIDYSISGITTDYANRASESVMGITAEKSKYVTMPGKAAVIKSISLTNQKNEAGLSSEIVVIDGEENVVSIDGNAVTVLPGTCATVLLKAQSEAAVVSGSTWINSYTLYSQPVTVIGAESVAIEIANVLAKPGAEIEVTYSIKGNEYGYTTLDLKIPYDNTIYEPIGAGPAGVLAPFFVFNPAYAAGMIRVAFASAENISGDGILFTVKYKVSAAAPSLLDHPLTAEPVNMQY